MNSNNSAFNASGVLNQAAALQHSGKLEEASVLYRKLLDLIPDHSQALTNFGTIKLQLGKLEEGVKLLRQSLEIVPNQPKVCCHLGIGLCLLKRFDDALASLDSAITLKPDYAEAYCNRGVVLRDLKQFNDSLASLDSAIELIPDYADAHYNRGNVLRDLNRFEEALASYDRAIKLEPGYADIHNNRGNALQDLKRFDEAFACFDHAIALKPGYAGAYWNKSILKLLTGDYEKGWELYEWRPKKSLNGSDMNFPQPQWLGEQSIVDKTLLIHAEQGLGDFIQFCRYIPMVEALGAKVVLAIPPALATLISTLEGTFTIIEAGKSFPAFDFHCPIMSLAYAFKTTVATIPARIPYLYSSPDKTEKWHKHLGNKTKLRIGLVWSGSTMHGNDHNRSIPLKLFEPLFKLPIEIHSLQKEIRTNDAVLLSNHDQVRLHQDEIQDFSDTAALVQEMDIVISVDTSVAHLAGALGKAAWILLPFMPDYRWMLDRTDSPWYPSATLFRQPVVGDWNGVILKVTENLHLLSECKE